MAEDFRVPRAVYCRCMWLIKDSPRLMQIAAAGGDDTWEEMFSGEIPPESRVVSDSVRVRAEYELDCIGRALAKVPEEYRMGILSNIVHKTEFGDFAHPNTWKKWKQIFIAELARELCLV